MSYPEWLDPTFVTNIITLIMGLVAVVIVIKQRAQIIIDHFTSKTKDDEIEKQRAENMEQAYELQVVGESLSSMTDMLNLIVQASKMSSEDKLKVMESATQSKQVIQKLIETKQARIAQFKQIVQDVKEDPMQALNVLNDFGGSILEKYSSETNTE